jgi:CheY-like chemotaxis protein
MESITVSSRSDLFELVCQTLQKLPGGGAKGIEIAARRRSTGVPQFGVGAPGAVRACLLDFLSSCNPAANTMLTLAADGCWTGRRVTVVRLTLTTPGQSHESQSWSLNVPVSVENDETASRIAGPAAVLEPVRRALVVDDDPVSRRVVSGLLNALGCRTTAVDCGTKAIALAMTERFDVIFMDCDMPEMSGYETTEGIRRYESVYTPIVAVTGIIPGGNVARAKCLKAGMDDYLPKPVGMTELKCALDWWAPLSEMQLSQS